MRKYAAIFLLMACTESPEPEVSPRPVQGLFCHDIAGRCLAPAPGDEYWCKACVNDCPKGSVEHIACNAWAQVHPSDLCNLSYKICMWDEIYMDPSCTACLMTCESDEVLTDCESVLDQ